MELLRQAERVQMGFDFVHSLRHYQQRTIHLFGQKIPHRPANGAGHPNQMPHLLHDGELPPNLADLFRIAGGDRCFGGLLRGAQQDVCGWVEEVNELLDWVSMHGSSLRKISSKPKEQRRKTYVQIRYPVQGRYAIHCRIKI
jgi:hypothetical protein